MSVGEGIVLLLLASVIGALAKWLLFDRQEEEDMTREGTGNWNRSGRHSGGYRRPRLPAAVGESKAILSIQCYERRHADCQGTCKPFAPDKCECACHQKQGE